MLNGILWVLPHRRSLADLPDRYPPYQTCHRRFQQWRRDETLTRLLHALAEDLRDRGKLDLSETFIDASFSSAKWGAAVGPTRRGKGSKIMAIADRYGLPIACRIAPTDGIRPRTVASCAGTVAAGKSSVYSLGSSTFRD